MTAALKKMPTNTDPMLRMPTRAVILTPVAYWRAFLVKYRGAWNNAFNLGLEKFVYAGLEYLAFPY